MEKLIKDLDTQLQLLKFTTGKSKGIIEKGNIEGIERQRDALRAVVKRVEELKLEIEQAKLASGENMEDVTQWSLEVENQQASAEEDITYLGKCVDEEKQKGSLLGKQSEEALVEQARENQLQFERAQLELKLDYEKKMEDARKSHAKAAEPKVVSQTAAKLPKLVITKFKGELTDWPRFWNQFETEIDRAEVAGVTKFSYLKELVDTKVKAGIDGLPFTTEGYERAKNILKTKYGKTSEVVNAYVQNIMSLPAISGSQPVRIHDFYEKLLTNVQSLETMGKLTDVNGYVRMTIDKLEGIRGDLVRTDDAWQEWKFPQLVEALRKWAERNPIPAKYDKSQDHHREKIPPPRDRSYQTQQKEQRMPSHGCVYCDGEDHRSVDCKTVATPDDRKRFLANKRLCFNCTGSRHRAADCKSRTRCQCCQRRHHTSICDRNEGKLMTAKSAGNAVVYPVVVVEVEGVKCRALLDTGAGSSYASAALLKQIRAQPHHSGMRKIEMMLGTVNRTMETYRIKLRSVKGDFEIEAGVTKVEKPQLTMIENPRYKNLLAKYPHLKGVTMDDTDDRAHLPVHLILGNSEWSRISTTEPQRVGREWDPVASYTKLGWTITSPGQELNTTNMLLTQTSSVDYEELCKMDVLGLADSPTGDQSEVYEEFKEQLRRSEEGWYETGLPWKGNHPPLPNNKGGSLRRLASLVRKLEKTKSISDYNAVIQEQLADGVVERAPDTVQGREFYIPHKGVVRETAESTKLRIVYDASARAWDGAPSLNECLNTGPPLQNQLWSVLVRGRFNPVAITGDVKKAFLQVRIRPEDRDALRFHWLKNVETKEVETLRFTRALFGLAPSPFLLGGVIEQHLNTWSNKHPEIVREIKKNLYVDDLIGGGTTTSRARKVKTAATEIFADAALELHKWHSNVPELESPETSQSTGDQTFAKQQLGIQAGGEGSLLGLKWDKRRDILSVAVPTEKADNTKRGILAKVASIYDPLGAASPLTLGGKLLYRDACNLKVGWDEQLPPDLAKRWAHWESNLPERIPFVRSLVQFKEEINSIALHVFGDASGLGVAAAAFTVVTQSSGVTQGIVAAKARLAKQGLTIPRLELVAGHMAANLATNLRDALEGHPVDHVYCWLDSTVALHWIRGEGNYKQFVHNRVHKIQQKAWITWRHVPTKENPADLGSRGGPVKQEDELWWHGPEWLSNPSAWPENITTTATVETLVEAKTVREIFKIADDRALDELDELLHKRNLWRVLRVGAWVARFVHNARNPSPQRKQGPLTSEELNVQRRFWERRAQREGMQAEQFEEDRQQLNLQLNDNDLLECRGRIQGVYPVYLPDTTVYTEKFIQEAHEGTLHGGAGLTMAKVREQHWVPRLRRLVRRIIKKCAGCKRFQAAALAAPPPGLLPRDRTEGTTPFQVVGVDYAGPIKFRVTKKREGKAYVILYACSLTRALHLDLARSMETSEFLLSLKGLIARRGRPRKVYSDNGSTFIGAAAWIRQVMSDEKLNDFLARHQISWQFNLSRAPWWGGQFERMVGLVKGAMRKTIGNAQLTFDELKEVLLDVEVTLNGRPLSYVEEDVQLSVLTPNSMLYTQPNLMPEMQTHHEEDPQLRRRAKYLLKCKDAMWQRWTREYLRGMRERHSLKHKGSPRSVELGDVVIIKDDNKDRNKWKLGIVEELMAGRDGVVRAVKLRAGKKFLERAVQHLFPLELSCDRTQEAPSTTLNPEATTYKPRRDAAVAAEMRLQDLAQDEQDH